MKPVRTMLMSLLAAVVAVAITLPAAHAAEADAKKDKPTVAILYFDYQGKDEAMGLLKKGLAQMLISDLSSLESVQIVERDRLQDILDELKLNASKKIDKKTANKIGKLLGARYLVLGGYFNLMGTLRVDARVVEVETGRVIRSVGTSGKIDDFMALEGQLADDLETVLNSAMLNMPIPEKLPRRTKPRTAKVKRPKKLPATTAAKYGKALDAKDKGDTETAKKELTAVMAEAPDFELAALDLAALAK